ncbi:MAG: DUF1573 domain-containing protein [Sphingobacteriia bacterium]|nr:MAG: DUF1573 domain-containing protein [Sphingobacteriia bacterium]
MKIFIMIAAFFSVVSGCKAQQQPNDAKVSIQNEHYQMGKTTYGVPVEYEVVITNISNETLRLEGAKAGCGCTTPDFTANQEFKPGESVKVKIRFNGSVTGKYTRYTDITLSGGIVKQVSFSGEGIQ